MTASQFMTHIGSD